MSEGNKSTLFMCKTDFEYELGEAAGGNTVFPSLEDAKANLKCWQQCGIVEVKVEFVKTVEKGTGW
jgi:hypothetical protein